MVKETQSFVGLEVNEQQFTKIKQAIANIAQLGQAINLNSQGTEDISGALQIVLTGGLVLAASDIHFEPEEENVKLRLRLDGLLHDIALIEASLYRKILARIKLLSELKLNITERSQDGRFTLKITEENKTKEIEIRVSVLPSEYGEAVVMRILNPSAILSLDELGIRDDLKKILEKEIARPNGMIIVTGPTGSGKTTTLYAVLKKIQNPELKIITLEDPIEYHLEGISQSQINTAKGYDFASGLQAIVRQDPDAILVGEIRDQKTAQMAIQAALTGHLVLTTLHTNDAAGTIARLQALGEVPNDISSALNLVVAQRLARKICHECSQSETASAENLQIITKELNGLSETIKDSLEISLLLKNAKLPIAKGCSACNNTGYRGRVGLYELMIISDEMENFIVKMPTMADLNKKARENGMTTMKQDGLIKVLQGITTMEEVIRVVGE
ncbi:MAG: GspE/PulE family protein [Candidatus Gribaldobacteria bacterium]|nr:GspE/PulE family protein [Candidatus Gribaldobacteria bacterium]